MNSHTNITWQNITTNRVCDNRSSYRTYPDEAQVKDFKDYWSSVLVLWTYEMIRYDVITNQHTKVAESLGLTSREELEGEFVTFG